MRNRVSLSVLFVFVVSIPSSQAELWEVASIPSVTGAHDVVISGTMALVGCTVDFPHVYHPGTSIRPNPGLHAIDISDPRRPELLQPSPLGEEADLFPFPYMPIKEIAPSSEGAIFAGEYDITSGFVGSIPLLDRFPPNLNVVRGPINECPYFVSCSFLTTDLAVSGTTTARIETFIWPYDDEFDDRSYVALCNNTDDLVDCLKFANFHSESGCLFTGVDIFGDLVFLSGSTRSDLPTGLHILRMVDDELVPISTTETGGSAEKVKVKGHYAYVADGENGLTVVDWFDPYCPRVVGRVDTPGPAINVAMNDQRDELVVSMGESGVALVGIDVPRDPILLDSFDTAGYARSAAVNGRYVYIADVQNGLVVLRSNRSYPRDDPPPPPEFHIPCDVDVRPGWGDGFTDSHDLLSWMDRIEKDEIDSQNLFVSHGIGNG